MLTVWGEKLDRNNILKEYPRPQLQRDSYFNLNGEWEYTVTDLPEIPEQFPERILVPFSPECELSGNVTEPQRSQYSWYRLKTTLPQGFRRERLLLHFGAVDQMAVVWVNGIEVGSHIGGFTPFSMDISHAVENDEICIIVRAADVTDGSYHSRGKQSSRRGGIWYTPQSGIWQTVWMESVPEKYIRGLRIIPHFDEKKLELWIAGQGEGTAFFEGREHPFRAGEPAIFDIEELHPWSPEDPYLYDLKLKLGEDEVSSYFAMRKFSVEPDGDGVRRLFLNGRPYFHNGLLDQGYWSDGMLTAPSDEALIYDIQTAKDMGFNMLRKHIKLEPLRWYYHCDRLGMLVWQDMPSGGGKYNYFTVTMPLVTGIHMKDSHYRLFARANEEGRGQFYTELREMINTLFNCPCIAMWVPFNEGWGQFDAKKACELIWSIDQSRTIDHASGWHDQGFGETKSLHVYFKPYRYRADRLGRAVILSEFGGYNHRVNGHCFNEKDFGYKRYNSANSFGYALKALYREQIIPAHKKGLSAAVYTQLSDVEDELNGLLTYDRRVIKIAPALMRGIVKTE